MVKTETDQVLEWSLIDKPLLDDRDYLHLTLPNKLQVLLVSDPNTDKSSAALDVHVGHLCDPDEFAGLAHFCEHLLFMGTKKYPIENEYSQYLSEHGGYSNAFTGAENTNYYFEVGANHLEGALDRFAQFFIDPLFDESGTEREMNAVDSEHKKNIQSDGWRLYQLEKDLSNPNHPYTKFGSGNIETLKIQPQIQGLDIRKSLLDFHERYYSANIMRLVILGKESIPVLKKWTMDLFSTVRNTDIPIPEFPGHPLTENELQEIVLVKPVKDIKNLEIVFPFPDSISEIRYQASKFTCLVEQYLISKPSRYLSHLIGHEGEGSILSYLKEKGWALGLHAGASRGGMNFGFFRIGIDLTVSGVEEYEQVLISVFQYIKMMRNQGVEKWIFDECAKTAEMTFRFKEKSSPSSFASSIAGQMHLYGKQDVLSGPYLMLEYDATRIKKLMDLLRPENSKMTLVSPDFDTSTFLKAKLYGTEYMTAPYSADLLQMLSSTEIIPELHLPKPNLFIPEDFHVEKVNGDYQDKAIIIINTDKVRIWHKKDDTFYVPKMNCWFNFINPDAYSTPRQSVLSRIFVDLLKDSMTEYSYFAEVAGLSYDLESIADGLLLSLEGYNDKIPVLLKTVLDKMKNFKTNEERFKLIKEQIHRAYKNWFMESPHQHAMYYLSFTTRHYLWSTQDKLNVIDSITPQCIDAFAKNYFTFMNVEGLIHGNVNQSSALDLSSDIQSVLNHSALPVYQRFPSMRTHELMESRHIIIRKQVHNSENVNSAIEYYLQIGDYEDDSIRAQLDLFAQIFKEPCFDQLRTKEQLGYMVFSGTRQQTGKLGFRIIIQSEKHPLYLEHRIEEFLMKSGESLRVMADSEFQKHVTALHNRLTEKDKNLGQESKKLWAHVNSRYYDFSQAKRESEIVLSIQKTQMLEFYDTFIAIDSSKRRKLSTHMMSQRVAAVQDEALKAVSFILERNQVVESDDEMVELKHSLPLSKAAKPRNPISFYL